MPSYGIIGNPVSNSLSPRLHADFFWRYGIDGDYSRFSVRDISKAISALRSLGIAGANVTMPYKEEIIPFLNKLSPEAKAIGAVNTIAIDEATGEATGYNTDWYGFAKSLLLSGISISGMRFAVCGHGGASRAVCYALEKYSAKQIITFSTSGNGLSYDQMESIGNFDAVINCTPLGSYDNKEKSPVKQEYLTKFCIAVDLHYGHDTLFIKQAKELGLQTIDGFPMLIFQGAKSFEIWHGISVNDEDCIEICSQLSCFFSEI